MDNGNIIRDGGNISHPFFSYFIPFSDLLWIYLKLPIMFLFASDESCSFSRERYHGKAMRSPRLNFMPHKRRFSDDTESNLHERDTKSKHISSFFPMEEQKIIVS